MTAKTLEQLIKRRDYQDEAMSRLHILRLFALLWERQSGKSTTMADIALFEMMYYRGRTVTYASASLLLGTEIVLKQVQRMDTTSRQLIERDAKLLFEKTQLFAQQLKGTDKDFQTADTSQDKVITGFTADDFATLFENQKLEFRVYHDRHIYSRTKVIAPNVATARGWSGTVLLDEVAFIAAFKELMTALEPVISTNKDFRCIMGTTPPQDDDTHYSFELLAPKGDQPPFVPNSRGNWYESDLGITVHRADALDTHLAGKKIFDLKTGEEITPEQAYQKAPNKKGYLINHRLAWVIGGSAACDQLRLKTAQERGVGKCECFLIESDLDFEKALAWLAVHLDPQAKVGLGFDVATTTNQKSNPSVLAVSEQHGPEYIVRAFLVWKTRDPDVAEERVKRVIYQVGNRPGGRARALAVDATNEKYFAEALRKRLSAKVPVILVVSSEGVKKKSLQKPTNWKTFLGEQYVGLLDDNHLTLPASNYIYRDHRLVMKDRGSFVCEPDEDGRHGDTFDGGKLSIHALTNTGSVAYSSVPAAMPKNRPDSGRRKGLEI